MEDAADCHTVPVGSNRIHVIVRLDAILNENKGLYCIKVL